MGLSTLQENYHASVGVYYTLKRKHNPTKGLWACFDRYYKVRSRQNSAYKTVMKSFTGENFPQTGLFCDVSVYCRNSDVPADFVTSGFGDFVKIKCHSLVLATFSEQLGNLLMWCAAANDTSNASNNEGNSDNYVLVLPDTPASEMVKFLDQVIIFSKMQIFFSGKMQQTRPLQVYESLSLMDEEKQGMSLETSAQLMDLFSLKPDNIDLIDLVEPFYPTTLITQASMAPRDGVESEDEEGEAIEDVTLPSDEPEDSQVMQHALDTAPYLKVVVSKIDTEGRRIQREIQQHGEGPKPLSRKKVKPHPVVVPKPVLPKLMVDGGVTYVSHDPPAVTDVRTVALTPRPVQKTFNPAEKENMELEPPQVTVSVGKKRTHADADFAKPNIIAKKSKPGTYSGAKRGRKPGRGGRRGGGGRGGGRKRALHDDGSRSYDESAKKTLMTKFQKTSVLHFESVEDPHDIE